ncbi:hypothetical protein HAX54_050934 [Datura stramonium]|uniref:Putative plant transposon protein domain-containing protein n=1 Tax=Datura stramonium TaxID=4076 RepID=A0ABS8WLX3_DATST|nr:hypothetical protein [Datura stramonium]
MTQLQWTISRGLIHQHDLKFDACIWLDLVCARLIPSQNTREVPIEVAILISCIMDNVHINVGEIIADQFKRRAKQQATSLPYPSLVSMLCGGASCPLFRRLDKTMRADGMITLATKIDKDAPAMKQAKGTENRTPPPPYVPSNTPAGQFQAAAAPTTTPPNLLKLAQMAQVHKSQLMKLAKAIPSMIQQAIKKAMQPARDKLKGLCTTVKVLENEVITLMKEVSTLTGPSASNPTPPEPAAVPSQPEAPKSPSDDWWVGYDSVSEIVSNKEIYHNRPPPPLILFVYNVDPSWKLGGVETTYYHELHTLLDKLVGPGPGKPLEIPPDLLRPTAKEMASWHFNAAMYS